MTKQFEMPHDLSVIKIVKGNSAPYEGSVDEKKSNNKD